MNHMNKSRLVDTGEAAKLSRQSSHHKVGVADVVFDEAAADDDHASVARLHGQRIQVPQVYKKYFFLVSRILF